MTCRALREISESPPLYESVYLLDIDHNYWNNDEAFLKKCYDHGNPYAIYMKGCHDFFIFGAQDKGLTEMKVAADKGSAVALYTYAMLRHIIFDDFSHLRRISRETIVNTSMDFIKRLRRFQPNYPNSIEVKKKDDEDVYYLLHSCKCTPYDEWFYWFDKDAKGPEICEQCLWSREVSIFFKFFGFTAFVNTCEW